MSSERRRIQRVHMDVAVYARISGMAVRLLDVSADGARVEHIAPLVRGREIQLEMMWEETLVILTCEVIRCRLEKREGAIVYTCGLRYSRPADDSVKILRSLLAQHVSRDFQARRQHLAVE